MIIIPAIDLIDGQAVRLTKGDFNTVKVYSKDPVILAKTFEDAGLKRLHVVDLQGAKNGVPEQIKILEKIAGATSLSIDFGGGITTKQQLKDVFNAGASMAVFGSLAVKEPGMLAGWIGEFGSDRFFIGADVLNNQIKIKGWLEDGNIELNDFIKSFYDKKGIKFFCTDISRDGAQAGPSSDLYKRIISTFPGIDMTASGGVTVKSDLDELRNAGCSGAIVGKAIYEQTISLKELASF